MNKKREFEDVMMSVVRLAWDSDFENELVATTMVDLAFRLQLMKEDEE